MVEFIKNKESGDDYGQVFCVVRDAETAFHLWKRAHILKLDVSIDGVLMECDWHARYALEQYFGVSYQLVFPSPDM